MSDKLSSFEFNLGQASGKRTETAPMRILLIGDFSGRPIGERTALAQRKAIQVDVDNIEAVIAKLAPRISTDIGEVEFGSLDDFHPDELFERLDLFQALRKARSQPAPEGEESPLASLLGGGAMTRSPEPRASAKRPETGDLQAWIENVVAAHVVPDTAQRDKAYVNAVDSAISEQMRELLHHPDFQAMEALWCGVRWLLANLELDQNLQLHLFDVTRQEIDHDLTQCAFIEESALFAALAGQRGQPGIQPWSLLLGLSAFGAAPQDLHALAALGALASHAGGPFIANAERSLWPSKEKEENANWNTLRAHPSARWIGLVTPRLLMRQPYGVRGERLERFEFEELGNRPEPSHYLWAGGALACGLLLGRSYAQNQGWSFSSGDEREVDDLPACTQLDSNGEAELVPCAEEFLSDAGAELILGAGIMPLLSHRHANSAMLMRFRSISSTESDLQGVPS